MSEAIKNIKKLVSEKITNRNSRLAESTNVGDWDEAGNLLNDYRLYFSGSLDALRAAGCEPEFISVFELADQNNETEMNLLEQRINLQKMLED